MTTDDEARLRAILEGLLCAQGEPLSVDRATEIIGDATRRDVVAAFLALREEYERDGRGFRVVEVANGYQMRTAADYAEYVRRLFRARPFRLTRAMLETLAIVAYKQLVTKPEIEAIRGVDVDSTLGTLLERRLIRIAGRKEVPGRPLLYATSREFLEVFGLNSLGDLPTLKELGDLPMTIDAEVDISGATAGGGVADGEALAAVDLGSGSAPTDPGSAGLDEYGAPPPPPESPPGGGNATDAKQ
jgi:segregation and condensation protein B